MMQKIYLGKLSTILLLTVAGVWADQEPRKLEFTVYGQYPVRNVEYMPISESALQEGEKAPAPIRIQTHSLARMGPHFFKGGDRINFYDTRTKDLVGRVIIPDLSNEWLLIFVRNPRYKDNPDSQLRYLIYPFNDSLKHLPNNSLVFLNISGKKLEGLLEDKRVSLSMGESEAYQIQESLPVNLWASDFEGKELLPALIKTYRFAPNHRYLMIFFAPVLTGSVDLDVRFLAESVE